MYSACKVLVCLVCVSAAALSVSAQDSFTLKVDVAMVTLDVAVFGQSGLPVTDLTKDDFVIYEDGRPQAIQVFASSATPYNTLLLLDRSGSMSTDFPFVIQAVNRFMRNLRPQDRIALAAFDDSFDMLIRWRSVRDGNREEIKLGSQGTGTKLYEALIKVASELKKVEGRKAVLVFTDGEDSVYPLSRDPGGYFEKALRTVGESKVPFNFVGLIRESPVENRLRRLAEASGGQVFIARNIDEVLPLYDRISRELGVSYTLGYLSDRPERDGSQREIEIKIPATEDYRVSQSRNSYAAQ